MNNERRYEFMGIIWMFTIFTQTIFVAGQACTWPPEVEGTWTDSLKGVVVFTGDTMTGWTVDSTGLNEWECVNSTLFATDGYLVMKATQTYEILPLNFVTLYRCVQMTPITEQSYRYYQLDPAVPEVQFDRVSVNPDGTLTDTTVLCDHDNGASGPEYQVMIVTGNEAEAKVQCPYSFVGLYDYTHETFSSTTCEAAGDTWDMCSDNTQVTFDYNTCSTKVAYSDVDTVWCVDNVLVETTNYAVLYNHDDALTDESTTYRFSCLAVDADNIAASISPQHCKSGQTPTNFPLAKDGSISGAKLTFTSPSTDCPPCPVLSGPSEGTVVIYTEGAVTIANYTCDAGNSIYGPSIRTCLLNGTWDPLEDTSCTCAPPADPANGAATMAVDVNSTTVTYTCDVGYVLVGNAERTCLSDINTWTGSDPTCDECQALTTPDFGALSIVFIGVTSHASFTCNRKYSMDGVSEGYCLNDTSWNSTEPTCTTCQLLTTLYSGSFEYNTSGTVTTAYSTCAANYTLVGSNPLNCLATGAWDSSQPTCACIDPAVPDNGTMVVSNTNTTATYTCDLYFTMDGSNTRTCLTDGTGWDGVDPICVECPEKTDPPNGSVAVTTNGIVSSASFRCALNYSMDGGSETRCQTNGNWLDVDPVCNECGIVYEPVGGSISLSTDNIATSAVFRCEVGRTIDDEPEPYCRSNGTWTDNAATRTCVLCATLPDLDQGSYAMATNGTHTTVASICNTGFTLAGAVSANCDSSGQWDVLDQQCNSEGSSSEFPWIWIVVALGCIGLLLLIIVGISALCNYKWYNKVTHKASKKEMTDLSLRNIITQPPPMNERLRSPSVIYQTPSRVATAMSMARPPTTHPGPSRPTTAVSRTMFDRLRQAITPAPTPALANGAISVQPPAKTPRPPLATPKPPPIPPTPKPASAIPPPTPIPVIVAPAPTPDVVAPPPTPKPAIIPQPPSPKPKMIVPPPSPKPSPITPTAIQLVLKPPSPDDKIQVAAPWTSNTDPPQSPSSDEDDQFDVEPETVKKPGKTPWRPAPWDGSSPTTSSLKARFQRAKRNRDLRKRQIETQKVKTHGSDKKKKKGLTKGKAMLSVQEFESNGSWKRRPKDTAGNNSMINGVVKIVSPIKTFLGRDSNVKKT